jgi:hypothetical protein
MYFSKIPNDKNLPLTVESPVLMDYMNKLICATNYFTRPQKVVAIDQQRAQERP